VASSGPADIELALDAAHAAKDEWAARSPAQRAAALDAIADAMDANREMLAVAETYENGKPFARRSTPTSHWPPITSATSPAPSGPRRAGSPRSTTHGIKLGVLSQDLSGGPRHATITVRSFAGVTVWFRHVTATTSWRFWHYRGRCGHRYQIIYATSGQTTRWTIRIRR
jgi:hypothetical protein